MIDSPKKKIGVTLPEALHQAVKSAAPLRGLNVEAAYQQALEAWLKPIDQKVPPHSTQRNAEWHARLDTILNFGSKEDVTGIQANLRWGAESVEKRRGATKSRAAS